MYDTMWSRYGSVDSRADNSERIPNSCFILICYVVFKMSDGRQTPSAASISSTSLNSLATPVSESYEGLSASFKVFIKERV